MDNIHERHDNIAENERYAYEIGINSIDKIANDNNGIVHFINVCARTIIQERQAEFQRLGVLTSYIASVFGGELDKEERIVLGSAFLKGVITGVCVADQAYDNAVDITDAVIALESELEISVDDNAFYRDHGPKLIESGHQALGGMFACNETIENWESACVPDIRYHRFYRMGLGIYMAGSTKAHNIYKAADLKQMGDQIDAGDIDWDKEFQNFSEN